MTSPATPRPHSYDAECWCVTAQVHEDDSYGSCVICKRWVPHTDSEYDAVPFPCPASQFDDLVAALLEWERTTRSNEEAGVAYANEVSGEEHDRLMRTGEMPPVRQAYHDVISAHHAAVDRLHQQARAILDGANP